MSTAPTIQIPLEGRTHHYPPTCVLTYVVHVKNTDEYRSVQVEGENIEDCRAKLRAYVEKAWPTSTVFIKPVVGHDVVRK